MIYVQHHLRMAAAGRALGLGLMLGWVVSYWFLPELRLRHVDLLTYMFVTLPNALPEGVRPTGLGAMVRIALLVIVVVAAIGAVVGAVLGAMVRRTPEDAPERV